MLGCFANYSCIQLLCILG